MVEKKRLSTEISSFGTPRPILGIDRGDPNVIICHYKKKKTDVITVCALRHVL